MRVRLVLLLAIPGLWACQTPYRPPPWRHEHDTRVCEQIARENADNPDVIVDMQPEGGCVIAYMLI